MPEPMEHTDAGMDAQLFNQMFDQRFMPIAQLMVSEIEALQERLSSVEERFTSFIKMVYDHGMGIHKSNLSQKLMGGYGNDLGPIDEFFNETHGRKFSDDIIEEMIKHQVPDDKFDDFTKVFIDGVKGKFGKYFKGPNVEVAKVEEMPPEVSVEAPAESEVAPEPTPEPEEDNVAKFMKSLKVKRR